MDPGERRYDLGFDLRRMVQSNHEAVHGILYPLYRDILLCIQKVLQCSCAANLF